MGDNSKIEWTDTTWNPIAGCSKVSEGCRNCYAETMAKRLSAMGQSKYQGTVNEQGRWTGNIHFDGVDAIMQPFKWKKPRRIFVNSMSDLFHESVPNEWIDKIFLIMALCPRHTFQILTKRPERMRDYLNNPLTKKLYPGLPFPNVWLGVSVENQAAANERIPFLLSTPAAVRFLSCEPLLGPLDLKRYLAFPIWVIVGGESGPNARPMHPDWVRWIRDQCQITKTPFFFKQWGEWISVSQVEGKGEHHHFPDGVTVRRVGKTKAGRILDGRTWDEMPQRKGF